MEKSPRKTTGKATTKARKPAPADDDGAAF
jgi:hypothetical protein